jgi:hypothetical protein
MHLLMVMINNGDGTFPEPSMIGWAISSTIDPVDSPRVADVDNDGFLDVFVSYYSNYPPGEPGGFIAFLKNKGDGTFFDEVTYFTPSRLSRLTLADVDNDGFTDVLCNNPETDNISILYNNKNGTFKEPVYYDTGTYPLRITTADIDKDGWIDMAVSCRPSKIDVPSANDIWIFLNNGGGTFIESERYGRGENYIYKAEIVDVDNDGLLDIIQSDRGYYDIIGKISVFRNVGEGRFDNSGIDIRCESDSAITPGSNVKIIVDFRTFPEQKNVDLYFVMVNPKGTLYSGFSWNEGIAPAFSDLTLPPDTNLFDLTLSEFIIPSEKPPVSQSGFYTFAMAMFKPGTAEILSNLTKTTFEVVE